MKANSLIAQTGVTTSSTLQQNLSPAPTLASMSSSNTKLNLSKTTVDMLSGSVAGIVATFVAHPLDTVKVRFQISNNDKLTLRECMSDIYRHEGVRGFFKGVLSPMFGRWPITALLFGSREWAFRTVEKNE